MIELVKGRQRRTDQMWIISLNLCNGRLRTVYMQMLRWHAGTQKPHLCKWESRNATLFENRIKRVWKYVSSSVTTFERGACWSTTNGRKKNGSSWFDHVKAGCWHGQLDVTVLCLCGFVTCHAERVALSHQQASYTRMIDALQSWLQNPQNKYKEFNLGSEISNPQSIS